MPVKPLATPQMQSPAASGWRTDGRLSGRTVLFSLIGFFAVVIGVNITMMTLAISTMPGTEVESPYLAGIKYNSEISAARAQDARGWRMTSHVDRAGDGRAVVTIEARDRDGTPLTGLALSVRLARPADWRADRAFTLGERSAGRYSGEAGDVAAGIWDVEVEADRGGERLFRSKNRVTLSRITLDQQMMP
jgi:nitrogen fixation protein FixH